MGADLKAQQPFHDIAGICVTYDDLAGDIVPFDDDLAPKRIQVLASN